MCKVPKKQVLKGTQLLGDLLLAAAYCHENKPLYEKDSVEGELLLASNEVEVTLAIVVLGTG